MRLPSGGAEGVASFANDLAEAGSIWSNGEYREFLGVLPAAEAHERLPAVASPFRIAVGRKGDPLTVWRPCGLEVAMRYSFVGGGSDSRRIC